MKLRKNIAKGLALGIIIINLPTYSFANNLKNDFYNEINSIKTKEDLQKSAQKAVRSGEIDTWIEGLANMPTERAYHTSAVVDGKIYCIGGYNDSYLKKVEVYDPKTDTWETKTPMPTARYGLTSAVVNGKIYCIGGFGYSSYLNKVEVYDPETDTWATKTPMPTKRSYLASAVVDGKIYCIGGESNTTGYSNKVEVYDPETDTWETKANMPTERDGLSSAVVDGKIYCIGGHGDFCLNRVEVYDPTTDIWETKANMPTERAYHTSTVIDGKIYCIGGRSNHGNLNVVEVYDTTKNTWETKANMPTERGSFTSAVVNGKIYCIGGYDGYSYINILEGYVVKIFSEEEAKNAVANAEITKNPEDIKSSRELVNQLTEGELKTQLQNRLDAIIPNLELDIKNATANVDIYIKSENMLLMSLSTNSITFEDYSGVEEIEKSNALTVNINSSLTYDLNAYLVSEIQNADGSNKIDIDRLNIKANDETAYQEFAGVNQKLTLKSNCSAGNNLTHNIDLKLNGDDAYPADIYKAVIKFEAEQK